MTLFRLDSSIRTEGSVSRQVADTLVSSWLEQHPGDAVVQRDLVASPLPSDVWSVAATAGYTPEDQRSEQQLAARALAATLADELIGADAAVIGAPLYNFGLSQHLKAWIDLIITDPRFSPGTSPLAGRPLTLVVARGGGYGAGTPRAGWDHATPYLLQIFRDVFGADVTLVEAELTLADVNPAMADLRDLAASNLASAHVKAAETGRAHAALVATAA